jgi:hypothetical protein
MLKLVVAICLVTTVALTVMCPPATADQGVSVSVGRIDVTQRLSPGGRYHLPAIAVTNVGDVAQRYDVVVNYLDETGRTRPPSSWFRISPSSIDLASHESKVVQLDIDLPTGARPGSYLAMIEAHPAQTAEGTLISAAAATRVSFSVKPANRFEAWRLRVDRTIDDYAPWSYALPALSLAILTLFMLRRSLRVNVNVERRR